MATITVDLKVGVSTKRHRNELFRAYAAARVEDYSITLREVSLNETITLDVSNICVVAFDGKYEITIEVDGASWTSVSEDSLIVLPNAISMSLRYIGTNAHVGKVRYVNA